MFRESTQNPTRCWVVSWFARFLAMVRFEIPGHGWADENISGLIRNLVSWLYPDRDAFQSIRPLWESALIEQMNALQKTKGCFDMRLLTQIYFAFVNFSETG